MHVVQPPTAAMPNHYASLGGRIELGGVVFDASLATESRDAEPPEAKRDTRLDTLVSELKKTHRCHVSAVQRTGKAFLEILAVARQEQTDMIVMGTHGRTGLHHMLIGSTAEKVVRMAPCSVLTVRHPEHQFALPQDSYPQRELNRKRINRVHTV